MLSAGFFCARSGVASDPPAFLGSSTTGGIVGTGGTKTYTHTTTAATNCLIVCVMMGDGNEYDVTSVKFNNVALTKASDAHVSSGQDHSAEIWYKLNPDIGAESLTIAWSGDASIAVINIACVNASDVTALDTQNTDVSDSSGVLSAAVTTSAATLIVACSKIDDSATNTWSSGMTELYDNDDRGNNRASVAYRVGTSAETYTVETTLSSDPPRAAMAVAAFK